MQKHLSRTYARFSNNFPLSKCYFTLLYMLLRLYTGTAGIPGNAAKTSL
jgi:hypothetical protein